MSDPRYSVVLFDLDGTIIDSAPGVFASYRYALQPLGIPFCNDTALLGPPLREGFARYVQPQEIEAAVRRYREVYEKTELFNAAVYNGIPQLLQRLRFAGCRLAVATSKPQVFAQRILQRFGLDEYFDFIGGASMSAQRDTKQAVLEYVFSQPGFDKAQAVLIGDRFHDMEGAAAVGIPALGVLYGYGSRQELASYNPVFLADTPQQAGDYLLGIL